MRLIVVYVKRCPAVKSFVLFIVHETSHHSQFNDLHESVTLLTAKDVVTGRNVEVDRKTRANEKLASVDADRKQKIFNALID